MSGRKHSGASIVLCSVFVCGIVLAIPARADDEIDGVIAANGKVQYEHYCTSCHGQGGGPGAKAKTDLRTYVARHGGKFPASDWLAIIAESRPASPHAPVWDRIKRDQSNANASVAARGVVGQIARYINSIQSAQ
jgi:mono/diheme cytochrome c family protein